jgi:hypothetical protein
MYADYQHYGREGAWGDAVPMVGDESWFDRSADRARWDAVGHSQYMARLNAQSALPAAGLVNSSKTHRYRGEFGAAVRIYDRDVVVSVRPVMRRARPGRPTARGVQVGFSAASRARCIHKLNNARVRWVATATLTYPHEYPDGATVKRHLDKFLKRLRRFAPAVRYFWVVELQQRGAPHIHMLIDRYIPKEWLAAAWYGVVGSGDERHLRAGTSIESVRNRNKIVAYMLKSYLSKTVQKQFSDWVGRVWGTSRNVLVPFESYMFRGEHQAISRVLRPMLHALKHRFKSFSWRGFSFSFYGGAEVGYNCLCLGLARVPHERSGVSWQVALN